MKQRWRSSLGRLGLVGMGVAWAACGGASAPQAPAEPPPPAAEAAGSEAITEPAESAVDEQAAAPESPPAGPAKLTVVVKVEREPAAAHVRILSDEGTLLAEGAAGQAFEVPSGELTVEASITDPKALIDQPTRAESVSVQPGEDHNLPLVFSRSLVKVAVNIRGKLDPKAVVILSKDGKQVAKLASGAPDYVAISPGRYQASVKSPRAEVNVSDLTLNEGATHNIPLNVNF
jgi:hypothetical protein